MAETELIVRHCATIEPDSLVRAIELITFLHEEVFSSRFTGHRSIAAGLGSGCTTLGLGFDAKNASVTACMVGGPAFNSKQVHENDVIIAIDNQEVKGPEIADLLIGDDTPGSVVELTLKRASGEVEKVILQRMPKSLIADKLKMFALFTRILDRSHKVNDSELIKDVQEATDFWTLVMLEEHERDQICINNMHDMQEVCQTWLDELLLILDGLGKKCQEKDDVIKQQREELASNQEMKEKFRDVCTAHEKELADMNAANAAVLKAQLEKTRACSEASEKEKEKAEKQIEELMKKMADFEKDMAVGAQQLAAKDAELEVLKKKLAELKNKVVNAGGHNDVLSSELKMLHEQLVATREERDALFKEVAKLAAAHTELEANQAECIAVKDSSIAEALTRVEAVEKELQIKNADVEELKRRTAESEGEKQALEYEVQRLQEKIGASDKLLARATQEIEAFINKLAVADSDLARTQQVISEQHQRMAVDKDQIEQLKARVAVLDREPEVAALKQQEMEEKFRDVCTAHEKELADMNAANAVLKAKLQNALARVVCSRRELEEAALEMEEKLSDVCTAHEKELADMNAANAVVLKAHLDKTRAGSEASEKEKEKAEKQIEELMKKLSDFEKDMAVGTQQLAAKDAELEVLKKKLAELKNKVVNAGGHNDVLSSELKMLHEQLVATREERDALFKEVAKLAAAHTELEANQAECIAVKDSSIAEALTRVEAVEKELQIKNADVEELKRRTAESEGEKQALEYEVKRLQEKIGESDKLQRKHINFI